MRILVILISAVAILSAGCGHTLQRDYRASRETAVGFSARLVSVATGEVVWAASVTRSSYDLLFSRRNHLNRVAQLAVMEMVRTLL
jgi:hypothetical protein